MAKYPSTQFIVDDQSYNTKVTTIVPQDARSPLYMAAAFSSKGEETVKEVYGDKFYKTYGNKDSVSFKKYGQPLLQASMDINAGARLLFKRCVFEDSELANATFGLVLTKSLDVTLTLSTAGAITGATVGAESTAKYTLTPVVYSVQDQANYPSAVLNPFNRGAYAAPTVGEGKEFYQKHIDAVVESIFDADGVDINTPFKVSGTYIPVAGQPAVTKTFTVTAKVGNAAVVTPVWTTTPGTLTGTENEILASIGTKAQKSYVFPLHTIFDNGRGVSQKAISYAYDAVTSRSLNTSIYSVKVYDAKTNEELEKFSFAFDPSVRNAVTGYSMDIETVAGNSSQIKTKEYSDIFDKLVNVLTSVTNNAIDSSTFRSVDMVFGVGLANGAIINTLSTKPIVSDSNLDGTICKYYYYNYAYRTRLDLTEVLGFGYDGGDILGAFTSKEELMQEEYRKFFGLEFDKNIEDVTRYYPNFIFDANYSKPTKLAIMRLAAIRGDIAVFCDMNQDVKSLNDVVSMVPADNLEGNLVAGTNGDYLYIRDRSSYVTSVYGTINDPYTNRKIVVTATYRLSILMVNHYKNAFGKKFCGVSNNITFPDYIEGTINFIPRHYSSAAVTSVSDIMNTYPSDGEGFINEKKIMNESKINYGSYVNGVFAMDTDYSLNPGIADSDLSFIGNVMIIHAIMQDIRKRAPYARNNSIGSPSDVQVYTKTINEALDAYRHLVHSVNFTYIEDSNALINKEFYGAIEIKFNPVGQAEVIKITAMNFMS